MVGTDPEAKGGISSVIRLYREGGLLDRVVYMASYTDGSMAKKLGYYAVFLGQYIRLLISTPSIRLVHLHTSSRGSFCRKSVALLISKALRRKALMHVHGAEFRLFYERSPYWGKWLIRALLGSCDGIIALSWQWRRELFEISGNPKIKVIYNPTVLKEPNWEGSPDEPVNFLFMGRLGKRKGVYDIVQSARQLRSPNVRIHLYGDGEVEELRELVKTSGLEDRVAVRGWIDGGRKAETFQEANVLLLPSYNEGLPVSVLEAMAYGMPVVASAVGGIPEAVEDQVSGYLVEPGRPEQLAGRIDELAASPELRRRMGQSGYEIAARKFDLNVIIHELEDYYDELLNT
jgi:glycosyltransferase involved in cell wall biosynthesis